MTWSSWLFAEKKNLIPNLTKEIPYANINFKICIFGSKSFTTSFGLATIRQAGKYLTQAL